MRRVWAAFQLELLLLGGLLAGTVIGLGLVNLVPAPEPVCEWEVVMKVAKVQNYGMTRTDHVSTCLYVLRRGDEQVILKGRCIDE